MDINGINQLFSIYQLPGIGFDPSPYATVPTVPTVPLLCRYELAAAGAPYVVTTSRHEVLGYHLGLWLDVFII